MDEWAIWNRVLTNDEVTYLYNNGQGRTYPFEVTPPPLPSGWLDSEYSYDGSQPHAVAAVDSVEGLDEYSYDPNGNMTTRLESEVEWTQIFNSENRLASVSNGADTWTFVYDGDGNRVKQINPDGTITLLLGGGIYTVEDAAGTPEVTKYYSIAGQRVAMESAAGLQFLLTDHLGSVVGITDSAGEILGEQRYLPFGSERLTPDIGETDFGFTGQRDLAAIGLMDYNARWYQPDLGRFVSPDSIVPDYENPQSLNRYTYVYNGPMNANDPTGHCPMCVTALVGAGAGAIISIAVQAISTGSVDWTDVGKSAIVGAVAGATFGVGLAAGGAIAAATGAAVQGGTALTAVGVTTAAVSGLASGQTARATSNLLNNDPWGEGLFQPRDMALDAISGVVLTGAAGRLAGMSLAESFRYPIRPGAYSLVHDTETGLITYRPSTSSSNPPPGWVPRAGGHGVIAEAMGGNPNSQYGLTLTKTWKGWGYDLRRYSGSVNWRFPNSLAPSDITSNVSNQFSTSGWRILRLLDR